MKLCLSFLVIVLFAACNSADKKAAATGENRFVNPPIAGAQKPFENYKVEAERGDTLYHHSGSMLLFQPDAFLDKQGKVVKGEVDIKYREFNNPIDFYLNGISMNYDSSGTGYTLESSGMCEILAFKDGEPVFVNPNSKPEIILSSSTDAPGHNIYYLDTVKRNWVYEKPSTAIIIEEEVKKPALSSLAVETSIVEPVAPRRVEGDRPVIKIIIDTASFKELMVYDNLKFQVDKNEKNFRGEDANEDWTDMELQKDGSKGSYRIRFTNPKRSVSYKVSPVFEGEDYNKAMKVFERTNAQYKKAMASRVAQLEKDQLRYEKDTLRNLQIEAENARIAHLNRLAEIHNRKIDSLDSAIVRENRERELMREAAAENQKMVRSFSITRFGIINCDAPLKLDYIPITANFIDGAGKLLTVTHIGVVYSNLNSLLQYPDNKIRISRSADLMVFGRVGDRLAYLSYDDYRKIEKPEAMSSIDLPMTIVAEENNNYEYLAALAQGK